MQPKNTKNIRQRPRPVMSKLSPEQSGIHLFKNPRLTVKILPLYNHRKKLNFIEIGSFYEA